MPVPDIFSLTPPCSSCKSKQQYRWPSFNVCDALCLLRGLDHVILQVPPLRVRPADVLDFVRYFMRVVSKEQGVKLTLTPEAERALLAYNFPDNVAVSIKPQHGVRGAAYIAHSLGLLQFRVLFVVIVSCHCQLCTNN